MGRLVSHMAPKPLKNATKWHFKDLTPALAVTYASIICFAIGVVVVSILNASNADQNQKSLTTSVAFPAAAQATESHTDGNPDGSGDRAGSSVNNDSASNPALPAIVAPVMNLSWPRLLMLLLAATITLAVVMAAVRSRPLVFRLSGIWLYCLSFLCFVAWLVAGLDYLSLTGIPLSIYLVPLVFISALPLLVRLRRHSWRSGPGVPFGLAMTLGVVATSVSSAIIVAG